MSEQPRDLFEERPATDEERVVAEAIVAMQREASLRNVGLLVAGPLLLARSAIAALDKHRSLGADSRG